jgi:hypothetical protein
MSSVTEALTNGELPPQFDVAGRVTTDWSLIRQTSSTRTVSLDTPPVFADRDLTWMDHAACSTGVGALAPVMFAHTCNYECSKTSGRRCRGPETQKAKLICASCPVNDHCAWWATITNLLTGVAGGMTYAERLIVRNKLRRTVVGDLLLKGQVELEWQ